MEAIESYIQTRMLELQAQSDQAFKEINPIKNGQVISAMLELNLVMQELVRIEIAKLEKTNQEIKDVQKQRNEKS